MTLARNGETVDGHRFRKTHSLLPQDEAWGEQPTSDEHGKATGTLVKRGNAGTAAEYVPGVLHHSRPAWLARFAIGEETLHESATAHTIEAYGNVEAKFRRKRLVEIDVLDGKNLPSFDYQTTCSPYVVVKYEDQSDRTKPQRRTTEPVWNHFMVFKFFPQRIVVHALVYDWHSPKRRYIRRCCIHTERVLTCFRYVEHIRLAQPEAQVYSKVLYTYGTCSNVF